MTQAPLARRVLLPAMLAAAALAAAACGAHRVTYVPNGGSLTLGAVEAAASTADIGAVTDVSVADAPRVRSEALVELRRNGKEAGKAADVLTSKFPLQTKAVPVLVEAADVAGRPVWVVVEAWGDRTGMLKHRRLWVLARDTGEVVAFRTWR